MAGGLEGHEAGTVTSGEIDLIQEPSRQAARASRALRFALPATIPNVPEARHRVGQFLRATGAQPEVVGDVEIAITEAVANAVRHAFPSTTGEVEVLAELEDAWISVLVRDEGKGIWPSPARANAGLGLMLMRRLSDSLEIKALPRGGTEVRMRFRATPSEAGAPAAAGPRV